MRIQLERLVFDGVGPFRKEQVFEIPSDGVTYVYAPNGHGKTATIDLVRWLIRGPKAVENNEFRSLEQEHEKNVINHHRFRNMQGGRAEAILGVEGDGRYRVQRVMPWGTEPSSKLSVERETDTGWVQLDEPEEFLAQILPHERLGFNLLTGEHVRDFVEDLSGPVVKESVERLLQNPELVSLHDQLTAIVEALEADARAEDRAERRRQKLLDERADLKKRYENFQERVREKEQEEAELQAKIEDLNQQIARLADVADIGDEREQLEEEIATLEQRLDREAQAIADEITPSWRALVNEGTREACEGLLETYEKRQREHDTWEDQADEARFLDELLERDTCVCGTQMDDEHRGEIRERIEQLRAKEPQVPALPVPEHVLRDWASGGSLDELAGRIEDHEDRLDDVVADLEAKRTRKREVERRLEQADEDQRETLERQLKSAKMKLRSLEDEKSKHVRNQLDVQERLNEVKTKLAETGADPVDGPLLRKARAYRNAVRATIDRAVPKLRGDLVSRTQAIFDQLFQKDADYDVELNGSTMVPQVVRRIDGEEEIVPLSEGEKTRLGLALLFAFREVAVEHPFLLLDAPFSTLDDEGVHRLLELIADHEGQVVVFTKDAFPAGRWYEAVEAADPDVYRMDWVKDGPTDREGHTEVTPAKVEVLRLQGATA